MTQIQQMIHLLRSLNAYQRREIFQYLRKEFPIHPLEEKLNVSAEIILEAIERAPDITQRGIRGLIAEASFEINVVRRLTGWKNTTPDGNWPFDFRLADSIGEVRVQVKMQRLEKHVPLPAKRASKDLPEDCWVTETQRTRGGKKDGKDTRPYRFGEFDILAVSMHPSTQDWSNFMYTVANWLLPRKDDLACMRVFQPVSRTPNDVWTDEFKKSVLWFRSGEKKSVLNCSTSL